MKIVLQNCEGYYTHSYSGKYDLTVNGASPHVGDAQVFTITLKDGELNMSPSPPKGDWTLVPVRISVD